MRRLLCMFCLLLCLSVLLSVSAGALSVSGRCAYLLDADTGRALFEKDADRQMLIASTTKIMTGLLVLENCEDLEEVVTVRSEIATVEGSGMYLKDKEQVTVRELLYGLLLMSGNDAAQVLADHCAGSTDKFIGMMNRRAEELGLTQTHFDNPHGLDSKTHRSCARDMAALAVEAMKNPKFREIVGTPSVTMAGRTMRNHNRLLNLYPSTVGLKTGFTREAGRCLVSAAERDGRMLVAVTLNAPDDWNDHMAMYNYGFSAYQPVRVLSGGVDLAAVPVLGGTAPSVPLYALEDVTLTLTREEQARVKVTVETPPFVWAPAERNDVLGYACVMLDGRELSRAALFARKEIPESTPEKAPIFPWLFGRIQLGKTPDLDTILYDGVCLF